MEVRRACELYVMFLNMRCRWQECCPYCDHGGIGWKGHFYWPWERSEGVHPFTKEGTSSYKIKSRDGKIVSTKREELSAICDHMNIQVDNPMNVLTQGNSGS